MYDSDEYRKYQNYYRDYMRYWLVKRKLDAIEYKGGKCERCGYNRNYAVLTFHHRNPSDKEFIWSKLRLRSWEVIVAELDKCELLCQNCHCEEHYDGSVAEKATEWLKKHKRPSPSKQLGKCPHCGEEFERTRNNRFSVYCSRECVHKSQCRVEYPSDEEFVALVNEFGRVGVGKKYGVSEATIRKRFSQAKARLAGTKPPKWVTYRHPEQA